MTKIEANVPDYLARQALAVAARENLSVDHIVALALSAQLAVWKGTDDMATRAKRADFAKFDRIMADVPNVSPARGDELPEPYSHPS